MNNKDTLVVNLFGAPGSGKSTAAAWLFANLKMENVNAELVIEFAKGLAWENNLSALDPKNQLYILGNQQYALNKLIGKVDVILTDSPLLLSSIYGQGKIQGLEDCCLSVFNSYNNLNFFVERAKPYNPQGRVHTEEESSNLRSEIIDLLTTHNIPFTSTWGNYVGHKKMLQKIKEVLG